MENLHIDGAERSPTVDFDFAGRVLSLKGESYPEDVASFYGPVLTALDAFLKTASDDPVEFNIELVYFNSSSAKALMNILLRLDAAAEKGVKLTVNWFYGEDDDTMQEFGEDFSEDLEHVDFQLRCIAQD